MLARLWRWLRRLWQTRFSRRPKAPPAALPPMADTDYEFLFMQAMDGLATGWSEAQVVEHLGERVDDRRFADWLRRFGYTRLLKSPEPNRELAERMVQLGEMNCGELGVLAGAIGREMLREKPPTLSNSDSSLADLEFYQGFEFSARGLYEEAICLYDKVLENHPNHLGALVNRGNALCNLEFYKEAIFSYQKAIELKDDLYQAWYGLGNALSAFNQFEEAILNFEKALEIEPLFWQSWCNRGNSLVKIKKYGEAIISYRKALEINQKDSVSWRGLGDALSKLEQWQESVNCYEKALRIQPSDKSILIDKGNSLKSLNQYRDAINCYDEVLATESTNIAALINKGTALSQLELSFEAINCYDSVLAINNSECDAIYNKGFELFKLNKKEECISLLDKVIGINPKDHQALVQKGLALADLGFNESAIKCYDDALLCNPDDAKALNNKGVALINLKCFREAIVFFDRSIKINPEYYEAINNKGQALQKMGYYEKAIKLYDSALALKSVFWQAWINRGYAACNSLFPPSKIRVKSHGDTALNLDRRGCVGQLACYYAGLQYVAQSANPQGWGLLHWEIGKTHFFHSQFTDQARHHYWQAVTEYNLAFTTLTTEAFPEDHLRVLQSAVRAYLRLGDVNQATILREQGLAVFRDMLNSQPSPRQRELLELKFSGFSQLAVDMLVQSGSVTTALETAERYKNRTLTWMLNTWQETVISPSAVDIGTLVDPTTALVLWHLSPDALTRFVVLPGEANPQVTATTQPAQQLETWLKDWDNDYQVYRAKGKTEDSWQRQQNPWRQNLALRLATLRDILEIPALEAAFTAAGITHLRLVPHRDLHRLPIHSLFAKPFTITYLPSAQVGLTLQQQRPCWTVTPQTSLLSIEEPANAYLAPLVFAEIESALICQHFSHPTRLAADDATEARVMAALEAGSTLVHFTGHGFFNDRQPRQSALALAGTDQLTVETIRSLSLPTCGLISLAACETAVTGTETIQADYVGLASAFLKAGAGAVLSTLWTVESVSNAWLMVYFYEQLQAGKSTAGSLREAQDWLRTVTNRDLATWLQAHLTPELKIADSGVYDALATEMQEIQASTDRMEPSSLPYSDPYYWAAFVLTGICDESH